MCSLMNNQRSFAQYVAYSVAILLSALIHMILYTCGLFFTYCAEAVRVIFIVWVRHQRVPICHSQMPAAGIAIYRSPD